MYIRTLNCRTPYSKMCIRYMYIVIYTYINYKFIINLKYIIVIIVILL